MKIKDVCAFAPKSNIKAGDATVNGQYMFFTSSEDESKRYREYQIDGEGIVMGTGGNATLHYYNGKFAVSTDCVVLFPNNKLRCKYLYYFLLANLSILEAGFKGAGLKHTNKGYIRNIELKIPSLESQDNVISVLDRVFDAIRLRNKELSLFDNLVKAQFIEMFGTITNNPYGFPTATLKEVCHKITDGKHGGCEVETDSGYYYVGAREIYDGCIHYDTAPQISYTDFAKDYKRCNIERGDMVIVNTGATIGKTAIATSPLTERTLLQKSVALLKVKTEIISAEFLRHCYIANPSMYKVESASAQPNLLLSKMNATRIYLPPLDLQEQFVAFVEQIDKSKLTIQNSLDKLELLRESLMQTYFQGEN